VNKYQELIDGLQSKQQAEFGRLFLESVAPAGFGMLSKRELDVLIFSCMEKVLGCKKPTSLYEWSKLLGLTPQKVKNLQLEAYLKYPDITGNQSTEDLIEAYFGEIDSTNFQIDASGGKITGEIVLGIEDPRVLFELDRKLKSYGEFLDFRRNRELAVISLSSFLRVIADLSNVEGNIVEQLVEKVLSDQELRKKLEELKDAMHYKSKTEAGKVVAFLNVLLEAGPAKCQPLIGHLKTITKANQRRSRNF
jgi:hypothetical protein